MLKRPHPLPRPEWPAGCLNNKGGYIAGTTGELRGKPAYPASSALGHRKPPGPPAGAGFLEQDWPRVTGATAGYAYGQHSVPADDDTKSLLSRDRVTYCSRLKADILAARSPRHFWL
jgi:hypothetical protein